MSRRLNAGRKQKLLLLSLLPSFDSFHGIGGGIGGGEAPDKKPVLGGLAGGGEQLKLRGG